MQFTTKKDYAYEQIKNDILTNKLKPGDKLVIRSLAEKYDMSYIPIREAISQLFHEGLVQSIPYTGTQVAKISAEKVFETTALRYEVEGLCLRTALPHITPADIDGLYAQIRELRALYEAGDLAKYMIANRAFYTSFYDKSPYQYIRSYVQELYETSRTNTSLIAPEHIPTSLEQHQQLVRLVELGDTEGAVRCHREQKCDAIRAVFAVMRRALEDPKLLESSPVSVFFRREDAENDPDYLLEQLERLEKLF